jgi:hypothetical protein
MAVIPLGNGRGVTWEPTRALVCTRCRIGFDPSTSLQSVSLVHDAPQRGGFFGEFRLQDYWYMHNSCLPIEKILQAAGANIRWQSWDMPFILGFYIDKKDGFRRWAQGADKRKQAFPPGVYAELCQQWRPAMRGLDTEVTQTVDITSLELNGTPPVSHQGLPPAIPTPALIEKPGWLALRYLILRRDKYRCCICGTAAGDGEHVRLEVDHIVPRSRGGSNDPANLQTLCFACNRGKHARLL